jgi:23S rRNA (uracil1939-C5)-methyltransferase
MNQPALVEKLVTGGAGLSHVDNRPVFITDVLPGEKVEIRIHSKKAKCFFAVPEKIIEPSPFRVAPFCKYCLPDAPFRCGGCDWQHITHDQQLKFKKEIIKDCFKRIGKIENLPEIELFASPEKAYRHRTQLQIDKTQNKIGFFKSESNDVVDIDSCPVLVEPLNRFLTAIRSSPASVPANCARIQAIAGSNGSIASFPAVPGISCETTGIEAGGKQFAVDGNCFFQQNVFLLQPLGTWAAGKCSGNRLVDLFGGIGFFGVFLGGKFKKVSLIDFIDSQVKRAQENFRANGIDNGEFHCVAAERSFSGKSFALARDDCLVVDPPRTGLNDAIINGIDQAKPASVVYISCNPSTQARDVGILEKKCGYRISHAAMFDLYPQTSHIETEIILSR